MTAENSNPFPGWDRLRHGGLLLDSARLLELANFVPPGLSDYASQKLRQHASTMLEEPTNRSPFVRFVLETVCRIDEEAGFWYRGSHVAPKWNRQTVTGESIKPDHLWSGKKRGLLPVFIDKAKRVGVGNGRRTVSRALGWMRAGGESLAIVTNGLQWRLLFAGLDYDAWCEWDLDLWFEDGELSPQVTCLRTLIQTQIWEPDDEGSEGPLLKAIRDTRKGQADLSESLGERVRKAVEILIQGHGDALKELRLVERADIYRAACRIAMRLVVIFFAESRDLLPRFNSLYHESYGLNGLIEQLDRRAVHTHALAESYGAWPRVLALFGLIYEGSYHPDLPIIAYGGGLFAPGKIDSEEGISQALAVFENDCFETTVLPDEQVRRILEHLTRTTVRVRQGRGTVRIDVPVDFSDLSSEYIGVLYEGLLDYDLKTAPIKDPVVFLSVGKQPALPLSTLEEMNDRTLRTLFETLRKQEQVDFSDAPEDRGSISTAESEGLIGKSIDINVRTIQEGMDSVADDRHESRARADRWARRAVRVAGLVKKSKRRQPPGGQAASLEADVRKKAEWLVGRVVLPGEWYLVRWGGTRKGSGSFYTRPGLAIPTVRRTLRPFIYNSAVTSNCPSGTAERTTEWKPKPPEEILAIAVCDPACGSGSFPLAALRFLTDALYASMCIHGRIESHGDGCIYRALADSPEYLPCAPEHFEFESRLKAMLRRYVVEQCIYAVDLDPLAVELCRLSLWIETMDRSLPFGFLDHKVKCGNALIGTWLDQFQHYPVMAWKNRDSGDRNHSNGVHFEQQSRERAIDNFVTNKLKPSVHRFLSGKTLFQEDMLANMIQTHHVSSRTMARIHSLPLDSTAERNEIYYRDLIGSTDRQALKSEMDMWCACWFWPLDDESMNHAPLPMTMDTPSEATRSIAKRIASEIRFFHWELEFPDVFHPANSGFDVILGNPPWDIAKPASKEFFSNIDPLYGTYGKNTALRRQSEYFLEQRIEQRWIDYIERFRALSNYARYVSNPCGDPIKDGKGGHKFVIVSGPDNATLHERWRNSRMRSVGFRESPHPFRRQGGADFNLYKLFLEVAYTLLRRPNSAGGRLVSNGGRLGFIVPSGIYSDLGTQSLRKLFLDNCRWEWLFGFENRQKIFPVDSRQKFCVIIIQKGSHTEAINTAFMRHSISDWERDWAVGTRYEISQVKRFSPRYYSILEIQSARDLEFMVNIYSNGKLLSDGASNGWDIKYSREFDSTSGSRYFSSREHWEADGYRPDEYNRWIQGSWRRVDELIATLDPHQATSSERDCRSNELEFSNTHGSSLALEKVRLMQDEGMQLPRAALFNREPSGTDSALCELAISRTSLPSGIILSRDAKHWIHEEDITGIALPLYEGRMVGQFDYSQKAWISGKGRGAIWNEIPWDAKRLEPQFLMDQKIFVSKVPIPYRPKCAHMRIASATNTRTAVSTMICGMPANDKAAVFHSSDLSQILALNGVINSLVFDFITRIRLAGLHLDYHVLEQAAVPQMFCSRVYSGIVEVVAKLNLSATLFSPYSVRMWSMQLDKRWICGLTESERCRLVAILDALVAAAYRIDVGDMERIIRDCDIPTSHLRQSDVTKRLDPKGFWRVDQDKDPELRQPVLSFIAFSDLKTQIEIAQGDFESGVTAFLDQNDGAGWMLPDRLRLRDYGIGQDERADEAQLVAQRLGPRFHDWQIAHNRQEFWREAHLHARNVLGAESYSRLIAEIVAERLEDDASPFDRLIGDLSRDLIDERGYLDVLLELHRHRLVDLETLLLFAVALRDGGHLSSRLHSGFIDIVSAKPADANSDSGSGGRPQLDLFKWRRQTDLFD